MALTYPIQLPPNVQLLYQQPENWGPVLSWANSYRSLEMCEIPQQPDFLPAGSFVDREGMKAATVGDIYYITMQSVDPTVGPDRITVVARDAEVRDAYLAYGALPRDQVNDRLRTECNIIVREAIVPNVMNADFTGQGGLVP